MADVVERLKDALEAEYVVLGGGNAKNIKKLPPDTRTGRQPERLCGRLSPMGEEDQDFGANEEKAAAKKGDA